MEQDNENQVRKPLFVTQPNLSAGKQFATNKLEFNFLLTSEIQIVSGGNDAI